MKKVVTVLAIISLIILMGLIGGLENDRIDFVIGSLLILGDTIAFGSLVLMGRNLK